MKDLGPLHFFLGFEVNYFVGGIHLNQRKYVAELLAKTEMTLAKDVATPLARKHGVKIILRYIKGTLHFALRIISQSLCRLYGYSNADREVVSQLGDQLQVIVST
uniref:Reverse transcriptase Ty1/copia-type domain-containing protein n=1 Tax=Solanum lycopersicum TaxID=4081 RepID=A0A3Q7J535_SOLLC